MEPKDYVVKRIEGEYAYLLEEGTNDGEIFIALALLPLGVDVGSRLHYEMFEYTIREPQATLRLLGNPLIKK